MKDEAELRYFQRITPGAYGYADAQELIPCFKAEIKRDREELRRRGG